MATILPQSFVSITTTRLMDSSLAELSLWYCTISMHSKCFLLLSNSYDFEMVQLFYHVLTWASESLCRLYRWAHKMIGAIKHVTLAFFYGIFITTIRKSWNYEKKLCINNVNLWIYLVVIVWRYFRFKLNMKRTKIGLVTLPLYSLGGC
jgi:hypothetical protein